MSRIVECLAGVTHDEGCVASPRAAARPAGHTTSSTGSRVYSECPDKASAMRRSLSLPPSLSVGHSRSTDRVDCVVLPA